MVNVLLHTLRLRAMILQSKMNFHPETGYWFTYLNKRYYKACSVLAGGAAQEQLESSEQHG